jgi:hypothetical protein
LLVENMENVTPEPLRWLWPGVIPLGKVTMIVGDPGLGKSLLTLDMAARVSRGVPWPDGTPCQIGEVLLLSAEDDAADTIRPRLDAADALPSMIQLIKAVREGKKDRSFDLEADAAKLATVITDATRLIIIDPITAYLGRIDSHVTADVRRLLAPLAELAARRGVAIVAVSHLNKSSGPAIYRTTGSLAFVAAARAVWAVGRDPEDEERCLMLPVKQNLSRNEGGLAYRIEAVNTPSDILAPRVEWEEGRVQGDVTQLLQAGRDGEERSERSEAMDWLREVLGDGPRLAKELQAEAKTDGLSWATVRRAQKALGIKPSKDGFRAGWSWSLPPKMLKSDQDAHPQEVGAFEHLRKGERLRGDSTSSEDRGRWEP